MLSVRNLSKSFPINEGWLSKSRLAVQAVTDVSLQIGKGETVGLVGESGCGKSTLGRCILRLIEPDQGQVIIDGVDITALGPGDLRKMRRRMQIIFQDPFASLNPRMTVERLIGEPIDIHGLCSNHVERKRRIEELLDLCGLRRDALSKYPHEFSGGQRQRICIARALAVKPEFIVCDEPVSALDVSIQAQIINLLQDLQKELGVAYLFIAHDLKVVEHISSRVAVMYLGRIVEIADADSLYKNPKHPYTRALISAIPVPDPDRRSERMLLKGDVPSPIQPPSGCPFHPRCPIAKPLCTESRPDLLGAQHQVACHFTSEP